MAAPPFPFTARPSTPCRVNVPGVRRGIAAVLLGVLLVQLAPSSKAATPAATAPADRYATARREMGEHLYPVYRILERLMQVNAIATPIAISLRSTDSADCQGPTANSAPCPTASALPSGLPRDATLAWAVQLIEAGNSLASSQKLTNGGSLLRIDKASVDSLALKPSQLTCVIAQELAHASLDHPQRFRTRSHELDTKTATLINSAVRNANTAQLNRDAWLTFALGLRAVSSGLSVAAGDLPRANRTMIDNHFTSLTMRADAKAGGQVFQAYITAYYPILRTNAPRSLAAIAGMDGLNFGFLKRTQKDIDLYLSDYRKQLATTQLQLQQEADALSVEFVARAGIDPQACLEAFVSDSAPEAQAGFTTSGTSSASTERRNAMQAAINALPATLRSAGTKPLPLYAPMVYGLDRNSNTVSIFPTGTVPPSRSVQDKIRSVEGLLGR